MLIFLLATALAAENCTTSLNNDGLTLTVAENHLKVPTVFTSKTLPPKSCTILSDGIERVLPAGRKIEISKFTDQRRKIESVTCIYGVGQAKCENDFRAKIKNMDWNCGSIEEKGTKVGKDLRVACITDGKPGELFGHVVLSDYDVREIECTGVSTYGDLKKVLETYNAHGARFAPIPCPDSAMAESSLEDAEYKKHGHSTPTPTKKPKSNKAK